MQVKSAKELFSQKKSVVVVKTSTYTHSVEVKTLGFAVETLPSFSLNISLNRSDCGNSFGVFEVYLICINRLYFSVQEITGDFPPPK